jgi:hypothetical protein
MTDPAHEPATRVDIITAPSNALVRHTAWKFTGKVHVGVTVYQEGPGCISCEHIVLS